MTGPVAAWLPDGRRLHLQHGPIDLILEAWGAAQAVRAAYARGRRPLRRPPRGARRRAPRAAQPRPRRPRCAARSPARWPARSPRIAPSFITPMAAVAGAVADEIWRRWRRPATLERAYVNDGGDIALHLTPGTAITAAVAARAGLPDRVDRSRHADPVRGIATCGWRGRSFSLGIADAVTVLARTAADADAAATLIANAVDLPGPPGVAPRAGADAPGRHRPRRPAVTVAVGPLAADEVAAALAAGAAGPRRCAARGLIAAAALFLAGEVADRRSPRRLNDRTKRRRQVPEFRIRKTTLSSRRSPTSSARARRSRAGAAACAVVENPLRRRLPRAYPAGDGGPEAARPR